ncbi:MAG: hypothetical protein CM1200mP30_14070 [Pseudomonadota bacterium]|nr:MAG: hypothetical protein CM1200mP30_14070 [Pseudomonadota bacterium]
MLNILVRSLWNRRGTAVLTIFSIAISVTLFLGVEKIRKGVRQVSAVQFLEQILLLELGGGQLQLFCILFFDRQRPQQS